MGEGTPEIPAAVDGTGDSHFARRNLLRQAERVAG